MVAADIACADAFCQIQEDSGRQLDMAGQKWHGDRLPGRMSQAHRYSNATAEPSTPCSLHIVLPWWRHDTHCGLACDISCKVACQTVVYLAWTLHLSVICTQQDADGNIGNIDRPATTCLSNLQMKSYTTLTQDVEPKLLAGYVHVCRAYKLKQNLTTLQAVHQGSCYPCRIC